MHTIGEQHVTCQSVGCVRFPTLSLSSSPNFSLFRRQTRLVLVLVFKTVDRWDSFLTSHAMRPCTHEARRMHCGAEPLHPIEEARFQVRLRGSISHWKQQQHVQSCSGQPSPPSTDAHRLFDAKKFCKKWKLDEGTTSFYRYYSLRLEM
jgi:hypothetical protein